MELWTDEKWESYEPASSWDSLYRALRSAGLPCRGSVNGRPKFDRMLTADEWVQVQGIADNLPPTVLSSSVSEITADLEPAHTKKPDPAPAAKPTHRTTTKKHK